MISAIALPLPVGADAADGRDVYSLLRAERHEDVARYFSRRKPRSPIEYYALGQAHIQQEALRRGQFSKNQAAASRAFWQAAGIACDANSGAGFAACLKNVPRESKGSLIQRLALWRASKYAEKLGLVSLKAALLLRADLSVADPLSENLLSDRLQFYLQNGRVSEAVELAGRKTYGALSGPQASLWRARSFFKAGQKDRALDYYIQAMRGTRVVWLERAIAQDVRRNYPGHFRASFPKKNIARNLTAFAGYASKGEIAALRKSFSAAFIVRTTTADRVRGDGLFLIESGQAGALPGLSRAAYTYLSHTPAVLLDWTVRLRRKKQDGAALRLLADFKHVLPQNSTLWRNRIELLEKRGNRKTYFNEILAYQKRYHAHFSMADRMIEVLIGDNASQIRWAPESYWNAARSQLNPQTGNGRFVYWLKRYYLEKKNETGRRELKRDFYSMAPGSFYAGAFWEDFIRPGAKSDRADFARDWNRIGGRQDYLRWVARHGGNEAAVQYLKHRDLTAIWIRRRSSSGRISAPAAFVRRKICSNSIVWANARWARASSIIVTTAALRAANSWPGKPIWATKRAGCICRSILRASLCATRGAGRSVFNAGRSAEGALSPPLLRTGQTLRRPVQNRFVDGLRAHAPGEYVSRAGRQPAPEPAV